jgi:hypothetical protein
LDEGHATGRRKSVAELIVGEAERPIPLPDSAAAALPDVCADPPKGGASGIPRSSRHVMLTTFLAVTGACPLNVHVTVMVYVPASHQGWGG